jgi:hypothetical protein
VPSKEETSKEKKLEPKLTCSLIEVTVIPGSIFPCDPAPDPPFCNTCSVCRIIGLKLDCPDCCIDSILFNTAHDTCYAACGVLQDPTQAGWASDPEKRMKTCSLQKLMLKPTNPPSTWCDGKALAIKLCAGAATKIGYAAYLNCSSTPITGNLFVY